MDSSTWYCLLRHRVIDFEHSVVRGKVKNTESFLIPKNVLDKKNIFPYDTWNITYRLVGM